MVLILLRSLGEVVLIATFINNHFCIDQYQLLRSEYNLNRKFDNNIISYDYVICF